MVRGKSMIRSGNRRGTRTGKSAAAEVRLGRPSEPVVCEDCGAVLVNRTWRRDRPMTHSLLERAAWKSCPACRQARGLEYLGRVLARGAFVVDNEDAIRRRIANVAARAEFTQPLRRVVSVDRIEGGLEVLTTSQKLAHRIVHELKKAFRGRASYAWSDDGSLLARWEREESGAAA
jgi:hypothetical protein